MSTLVAVTITAVASFAIGALLTRWKVLVLLPAITLILAVLIPALAAAGYTAWAIAAIVTTAVVLLQIGYPMAALARSRIGWHPRSYPKPFTAKQSNPIVGPQPKFRIVRVDP